MPSAYEQELKRKYRSVDENLSLIENSGLNQEQKLMLQKFIDQAFKDSLQASGEQRQLDHVAMILNNVAAQNNSSQLISSN